jgi:hypothetical protein
MKKVGDYCLRRALARLPSASLAARRLLLLPTMVLGAALVIWKRKLEVGKDLKAEGLVKSWGVTPDFPKKTKCIPICMPGSSFMHIVT